MKQIEWHMFVYSTFYVEKMTSRVQSKGSAESGFFILKCVQIHLSLILPLV